MTSKADPKTTLLQSEGRIFIIFILFTSALWLSHRLSQTASISFYANLDYQLPEGYTFYQEAEDSVYLTARAKAFKLLFINRNDFRIPTLLPKENSFQLDKEDIKIFAEKGLGEGVEVTVLFPDKIDFKMDELSSKEVKIMPSSELKTAVGYSLIGDVKLDPNTLTIYGFKDDIERLDAWQTEPIKIVNLKADLKQTVKLLSPTSNNISISINEVEAYILVDQFIEKNISVPFNQAGLKKFNVIPNHISLIITLPMRYYDDFTADDVDIEIDSLESAVVTKAIKLSILPEYVRVIKLNPDSVEVYLKDGY